MSNKNFSTSQQLIKNVKNFIDIKRYYFFTPLFRKNGVFYGWGRKKSGLRAVELANKHNTSFVLQEDGFIRSLGLGVDGSPSFSIVEDDVGIYYDATTPSKLENILNSYYFVDDVELMDDARRAIGLILEYNISKYNNSIEIDSRFRIKYGMAERALETTESRHPELDSGSNTKVLVIAQTAGDASLKYGMLENFTTDEIIDIAIAENPNAKVYLKIHPDVLSGKKKSDIDVESAKEKCIIIDEDVNPISLLKHIDKVYTKTSQMGFEALLVGCECVCFGMPFYAGWGITEDKTVCGRRKRRLSVEEVFAGAYMLYTKYYNPYKKRASNIFDAIQTIVEMRK